jgi:hypothetical protein
MSALLQSAKLFSLRRVSEQEAITMIGRLALSAVDVPTGIESLARVALRLRGLHGVEVSVHGRAGKAAGQDGPKIEQIGQSKDENEYRWSVGGPACDASDGPEPRGSAIGMVAANAREWGRLRILFEPRINSVECPLRFARVLGQHVGLMLNRLDLASRKEASRAAAARLQNRLDTRKAVSRAAGILAEAGNLSHERAVSLLLRQAREERRPLLPLARSIILFEETERLRPIFVRN